MTYESDVSKVGGNLQKTVAYLLSLHKAEYEWNMLGIKVIGHVDALPIPDGTYEYGDTYMVGTETPYDMWIYTRADEFHSTDYWFNVGKFPQPGPAGPKGDGVETFTQLIMDNSGIADVLYDAEAGITLDGGDCYIDYKNSTTGATESQRLTLYQTLPFFPGKYINMDATADNKGFVVRVDEPALALNFYKVNKTNNAVPYFRDGHVDSILALANSNPLSLVKRDAKGDATFNTVKTTYISSPTGANNLTTYHLGYACDKDLTEVIVSATASDTGTIDAGQLNRLKTYPQMHIQYKNQTYYRMDPPNAPDGTLNFVHIDAVQSGGGYAARGKCFSITVSTRAWQVVDLSFGGSYTHNIIITDNVTNDKTYLTLTSAKSTVYEADELIAAMGERNYPCTYDSVQKDSIYAGVISALGDQFTVYYSNNEQFYMTDSQVTITDNVT